MRGSFARITGAERSTNYRNRYQRSTTSSGPPAVTGTAANTLPAFTSAASGREVFVGTAANSLPAFTSTSAGREVFTGTSSVTTPALTSAASGRETVTGTGASSPPALTSAAAGLEVVTGTSAVTLPALTSTAAGAVGDGSIAGTSAVTTPAFASAAIGVTEAPLEDHGSHTWVLPLPAPMRSTPVVGSGRSTTAGFTSRARGTITPPDEEWVVGVDEDDELALLGAL